MPSDTREKIQSAAEALFAEDGFDRVTLRQIARAAEQRNVAAVQYHFGSKKGLLEAIVERHTERLDERREELLAESAQAGQSDDLASLLRILIVPLAEQLDSASGRAYLRIQAECLSHSEMRPATRSLSQRIARELGALSNGKGTKSDAPRQALPEKHRNSFTVLLLFHSLADRARHEEKSRISQADRKAFIESLTRALIGVLRA